MTREKLEIEYIKKIGEDKAVIKFSKPYTFHKEDLLERVYNDDGTVDYFIIRKDEDAKEGEDVS